MRKYILLLQVLGLFLAWQSPVLAGPKEAFNQVCAKLGGSLPTPEKLATPMALQVSRNKFNSTILFKQDGIPNSTPMATSCIFPKQSDIYQDQNSELHSRGPSARPLEFYHELFAACEQSGNKIYLSSLVIGFSGGHRGGEYSQAGSTLAIVCE